MTAQNKIGKGHDEKHNTRQKLPKNFKKKD